MAFDVFSTDDIENRIAGQIYTTICVGRAQGVGNVEYILGALMVAKGMALSFGIPLDKLWERSRAALSVDSMMLLDSAIKALP